jgi:hypothetical protein
MDFRRREKVLRYAMATASALYNEVGPSHFLSNVSDSKSADASLVIFSVRL